MLANLVLELRVPEFDGPLVLPGGRPNPMLDEYRSQVASVVMACPNLERLLGMYTPYNHNYDRLTHALSTRSRLKEHVWVITDTQADADDGQTLPGTLSRNQSYNFYHYHTLWSNLETLMFYSPFDGSITHEMFAEIFSQLPSLRHVCISSFDQGDFHNETLLSLPPLSSLRLENVPGVTDTGLTRYTSTAAAKSLNSLTLIQQNVASLETITRMLSSLPILRKFTISQSGFSPMLPDEDEIIFQPILASPSLKHLHWDVPPPDWFGIAPVPELSMSNLTKARASQHLQKRKQTETPNSLLASSVLAGGFPGLLSLRAPNDVSPPGALQAVCRPTPKGEILQPSDKLNLPPSSRGLSVDLPEKVINGNRLQLARIRAQNCINRAAKDGGSDEAIRVLITYHSAEEEEIGDFESLARLADNKFGIGGRYGNSDDSDMDSDSSSDSCGGAYDEEGMYFSHMDEEEDIVRPTPKMIKRLTKSTASTASTDSRSSSPVKHRNKSNTNSTATTTATASTAATSTAITVHEFTLPAFVGRVSSTTIRSENVATMPPKFNLLPDIPGHESDGGLVDWKVLLRPELVSGSGGFSALDRNRTSSVPNLADGFGATGGLSSSPSSGILSKSRPSTRNGPIPRSGSGDTYSSSSARPMSSWGLSSFSSSNSVSNLGSGAGSLPKNGVVQDGYAYRPPSTTFVPRDVCSGVWNAGHRGGREWAGHVERERGWASYDLQGGSSGNGDLGVRVGMFF